MPPRFDHRKHLRRLRERWAAVTPDQRRGLWGLARDALAFLALALAAVSVDAPLATWTIWWPLPLMLASIILSFRHDREPRLRLVHLGWVLVMLGVIVLRGVLLISGPAPARGLREVQELIVMFVLAGGIWLLAASHPIRTLLVWLAALAIGAFAAVAVEGGVTLRHAGQVAVAPLVAWGVLGALWAIHRNRTAWRRNTPEPTMTQSFLVGAAKLGALVAGIILSWLLYVRQLGPDSPQALAVHFGILAEQLLWRQSLLVGWGHGPI